MIYLGYNLMKFMKLVPFIQRYKHGIKKQQQKCFKLDLQGKIRM
jgi:hypothetical protein